ncbi:PX domain-containing protein EREL1 [Juglans microcarpa x Juglans regia]|uniref:PX domain-containing protein EREL1 n=1 Tax=Juglans microcarpa x Juglans regia TaxID=2249226 RepID=UPI001B7D9A0F|nr:PX domain-containing protein EREL1 [Juglans microcarpa x Juglans regia]
MQGRSPPKHRHDGTSPLPLGMDWSPPPRKWKGRDTVWPHDPRTGWSYCVTIPSWVVCPKSRDSEPVVFYRVQVGVQSPEGNTTTRGILRRFNDFLKLFGVLKKAFPKKNLPPAPPKGLLRLKTRALLEERRCSLEEWLTKLLSDIDLSRSVAVASFLELEAAARFSFQDVNQQTSEASPASNSTVSSLELPPHSSSPVVAGSSSITTDYGSDTAYETSELGTPRLGRDDNSEIGFEDLSLDEDSLEKLVKYGLSNIDEGLFMGQTILEQLEGLPRHKMNDRHLNNVIEKDKYNGNASKASFLVGNGMELFSGQEHGKVLGHARKLSNESFGSDVSSLRGSEMSNSGIPNSSGDGSFDLPGGAECSGTTEILGSADFQFSGDAQLVLPLDQRHKLNRVLFTMQRRLVTAKTDMEDLIARLHQEIASKDYLATKVKDLEVELETSKQKSKENLQQALLIERERVTQMQWDMEELRRKSMEMDMKLKHEQNEKSHTESRKEYPVEEKDLLLQELDARKEQHNNLLKRYEELEAKSKADIKILVKEVKSLRRSQTELKRELSQTQKEKSEAEKLIQQERQMREHAKTARENLLHECDGLISRLQVCSINLIKEDEHDFVVDSSSLADALHLLTTSDDQIGPLLAEAQHLTETNETAASGGVGEIHDMNDETRTMDEELRKMLADIFIDNARLRKQVNFIIRRALKMEDMSKQDGAPSEKIVVNTSVET